MTNNINNYRYFSVTVKAGENVVDNIYKQLQQEGFHYPHFKLYFIGFEAYGGMKFTLNGNPMKVPKSGMFVTPYDDNGCLSIESVIFETDATNLDVYCIY